MKEEGESPPLLGGRATVLIVDDSPEILAVLGEMLQPVYRVQVANSGKRALQIAASVAPPDLILLDVMMPEMDGYTTLAQLQKNPSTRDIPVIFVTAMEGVEDEQRGLDLGAVDYFLKPPRPAIVLARVRTHLELKWARDWLRNQNAYLEAEVARRVAENLAIQEAAQQKQAQLNRQKELILNSVGDGVFGVDERGVITFVNPAGLAILGYKKTELLGKRSHDVFHHSKADGSPYPYEECPMHLVIARRLVIRGEEDTYWHKDGTPLPVLFSGMPMMERGRVVGAVMTFQDISERKRYLSQLERKSNYDDLTGLPNRNLLMDRLAQAMARCRYRNTNLAVLVFNLDRFKQINDSLGYAFGDKVLQQVAVWLGTVFSKRVDTLARLGGDEFVLLVEDGEMGEAVSCAQQIQQALAQPFLIGTQELFLTASIGIAVFPRDGEVGDSLLRNADAAVYRAKAAGGHRFNFYATEMNAHLLDRFNLENELRHAIERDELRLYYQPQLSLRSGEIIGVEALIRWQHPVRGLVSPADFVPLAEETGLILPIGEWVLRTACTQNHAWQTAGLSVMPMAVAVNVSAKQFKTQDVVALTTRVLRETGLDPSYLELELTESLAMGNAEAFVELTEALKALSVNLSIDDFGTGYSSLSYLKRFALDRLKIDQSFVRDITQDADSAAIVIAVIALAHSLGLSVIAEGVETEAQLTFLRAHGCDEMQGYYFSRPVPAAEFEQLLREGRKLVFPAAAEFSEYNLLLVDDDPSILAALQRLLRREGYNILTATSGEKGLELMATHEVAVVMANQNQRMSTMTGSELIAKVRGMYPGTIRILLSDLTDFKVLSQVVNHGEIYKFLVKPWEDLEVLESLREAFRLHEARTVR